jgi:hypothetical protein
MHTIENLSKASIYWMNKMDINLKVLNEKHKEIRE